MNKSIKYKIKNYLKQHLPSSMINLYKNNRSINNYKKQSFSQSGEDILARYLLQTVKGLRTVNYLDIGANHPFSLSNTALFYFNNKKYQGGQGVLIEPNPKLAKLIKKRRPHDIVLNAGISPDDTKSVMDFYEAEADALSTFSEEEMKKLTKMGHKFLGKKKIKVIGINSILKKYFYNNSLDFLSIDVEGMDLDILHAFDFSLIRPKVICIETISHRPLLEQEKNSQIIDFLKDKEYFIYADTYINTLFVDKNFWKINEETLLFTK